MNKLITLTLLLLSVSMFACSSNRTVAEQTVRSMPKWYENVPNDENFIYAATTNTSQDLQTAVDKSILDGRNQLAQLMEVQMSGIQKRFQEEVGLGEDSELLSQFTAAYKGVVDQTLNGSRPKEQEVIAEGEIYRAYVLMEMPIGEANQALIAKLRENQNLYTRFRATQAFEDMEKQVEAYRKWREENGQ
jgi:hypothetical protein